MRKLTSLAAVMALASIMVNSVEAATPINACGTVVKTPGSYVVTKNLTAKKGSTSPCIAVKSNYVAIDLGGFTINCNHADATGIVPENTTGLIVRNGIITSCTSGLAASGNASAILAEGLVTLSNALPGVALTRGNAVFRSVNIDNGTGLDLECPSNAIDNTALGNTSDLEFPFGMSGCAVFNTLHE